MKIDRRTFIVSGGSSGLGLATVVQLVKEGAHVAVLDLSEPSRELTNTSKVKYWKTDVTKVNEIERGVEEAAAWANEAGKPLAGAICSAGVGVSSKVINAHDQPHSRDLWDFALAVNLSGSFHLARLVLKHLIAVTPEGTDGERGTIIFASSAAAFEGQTGQVAYAATKGAVASMTLPMARDLARHGVRVISIAPSAFSSAMSARMPEKALKSLERELVFPKRFGRAEEFAHTVKWIIECPYVNGEVIRLTGGARLPGRL